MSAINEKTDDVSVVGLPQGVVHLCLHEPLWCQLYRREADGILAVCGNEFVEVEHIGSTSVPGLKSKPIIDILGGVRSLGAIPTIASNLRKLEWEYLGDHLVEGHNVFGKGSPRSYLLHVVVFGGLNWGNLIGFRDLLRSNREVRDRYEAIKTNLSVQFSQDRRQYTALKGRFIDEITNVADA